MSGKLNREQIEFVVDIILSATLERIEVCLPPNVPLSDFATRREQMMAHFGALITQVDWTLCALHTAVTGEECEPGGWGGAPQFALAAKAMIDERLAPGYTTYKPGEKCSPDCNRFASLFGHYWQNARKRAEKQTPAPLPRRLGWLAVAGNEQRKKTKPKPKRSTRR